jgi:hypothetical protein
MSYFTNSSKLFAQICEIEVWWEASLIEFVRIFYLRKKLTYLEKYFHEIFKNLSREILILVRTYFN